MPQLTELQVDIILGVLLILIGVIPAFETFLKDDFLQKK
jgi:hypothetical protein